MTSKLFIVGGCCLLGLGILFNAGPTCVVGGMMAAAGVAARLRDFD